MSSDAWDDIDTGDDDIVIESPGTTQTADACTIAVRSDGDIVVAYQGDSDMVMGTEFERIDWNVSTDGGVNWAGPVSIDNGGSVNWTGCVIVPGSSDRMHVFFKDDTNNDAYQRRINSDDSLETFPSAFETDASGLDYIFGPGVSYDDGGTQRVRCPYARPAATIKVSIAKLDSADTPTVTKDLAVSDNLVENTNEQHTLSLSVDVKNLQLLYANSGDFDLYRDTNDDDAGWGTDTEELDGVTVNHISPRVYDRSGQKLAFIYDDGGTVKYNEVDLGGATSGAGALTLGTIVISGTGVAGIDGIGALALAVPTIAGTGVAGADGTGALALAPPSIAGTGVEEFIATGALALAVPAIAGTGVGGAEGIGALLIAAPAIAGTGVEKFTASGALLLGVPSIAGTGIEKLTASGALALATVVIAGTGVAGADGVGALALGPPLIAGTAVEEFIASGALALGTVAIAGTGVAAVAGGRIMGGLIGPSGLIGYGGGLVQ